MGSKVRGCSQRAAHVHAHGCTTRSKLALVSSTVLSFGCSLRSSSADMFKVTAE